ncbi:MAG: alpha/beta fold hydrolase [Persicimonas sp.]
MAALEAPERFRAVVAIDIPHPGALRPSLSTAWSMRHFLLFQLRGPSVRWLTRGNCKGVSKLWRRWSPNWSFDDADLAPIRRCFEDREAAGAAIDYYRSFMGDQRGEAGRALKKLLRTPGQAPTLAITGDSGPVGVDDFRRSERYHEGKWELLVVPGAGHFVHREAPEAVVEKMLAFLDT